MLGNPDLVVAQLLGQLEEAQIAVEAFDHLRQIRKLAQTEDPEPCFAHVVLAKICRTHGDECDRPRQTRFHWGSLASAATPVRSCLAPAGARLTPCSRSR